MKKKNTIIGIIAFIISGAMLVIAAFATEPAYTSTYMINITAARPENSNNLSNEVVNDISKPCGAVAAREPDPNFHTS